MRPMVIDNCCQSVEKQRVARIMMEHCIFHFRKCRPNDEI
jgi:hypothetical protein